MSELTVAITVQSEEDSLVVEDQYIPASYCYKSALCFD